MAVSFPQLDIYYIDFANKEDDLSKKFEALGEGLLKLSDLLVKGNMIKIGLSGGLAGLGLSLTGGIVISLNRLIKENRFFIIRSQQELDKFENARENDWVANEKSLRKKQYYIRHPKKSKNNLLIESNEFYNHIEDELKDELTDFILSHCPAKHIKIERIDVAKTKSKGSAKAKGLNAHGSVEAGVSKKDIFSYHNPTGTQIESKLSQYVWLNNSLMWSISALSEGGSLTQEYENDYTFGLSTGEAKTLGLDLNKHKKFTYSIHIEC